jgi:hypothetical protein
MGGEIYKLCGTITGFTQNHGHRFLLQFQHTRGYHQADIEVPCKSHLMWKSGQLLLYPSLGTTDLHLIFRPVPRDRSIAFFDPLKLYQDVL